jgi:hypothetical protein
MSTYKRGTVLINGKQYGRYPDGRLYRIYSTADRPFMQMVDVEGETFLRVRQATEQGYTDCPVYGCIDLAYPTSQLRRARTIGGGQTGECADLRTAVVCACGSVIGNIIIVFEYE